MYHKIVLFLLIISNVMNVFMDRTGVMGGRQMIYVANAAAFVIALIYLFKRSFHVPKCYNPLKLFAVFFMVYFFWQYISPNKYFILNNYVRWIMNILFLFFFYFFEENEKGKRLMQIYIVTFIFECSSKIYNGSSYAAIADLDKRVGGDTASIGLALVVPLIFTFFKNKMGIVLYTICLAVSMVSLRRSSILAILVAIPFIWPTLKQRVNKKYIYWGAIISIFFLYKVWDFVGAKLLRRIFEYTDATSDLNTYGSGRTEFWRFLFKKYIDNWNWFLGDGLGGVYEAFSFYWVRNLSHAHNDVLEILYTFGIVGLMAWFLFLYRSVYYVKRVCDFGNRKTFYCAMAVYIAVAITSGCLLRAEMFPLSMAFGLLMQKQRRVEFSFTNKDNVEQEHSHVDSENTNKRYLHS